MKRFNQALLICVIYALCFSSAFAGRTDMPFNGNITFHGIKLTVPQSFIRDSGQSNQDFWIFERDWYSAVLLISRSDDADNSGMEEYTSFMESIGAEISHEPFMNTQASIFSYFIEDTYCLEIMFPHQGSLYAISLRGGDEAEFRSILAGVSSAGSAAKNARKNIQNGILKDLLK